MKLPLPLPLPLQLLHGTANYVAADQVASGYTELENKLCPALSPPYPLPPTPLLRLGQVSLNSRAASVAFYPSKSSNEKGCKFAVVAAARAAVCDNVGRAHWPSRRMDG